MKKLICSPLKSLLTVGQDRPRWYASSRVVSGLVGPTGSKDDNDNEDIDKIALIS